MNQIKEQSNCIKLVGIVRSSMFFSHEVFGENFFEFYVEVARLSEAVDILPVIISERLLLIPKLSVLVRSGITKPPTQRYRQATPGITA